MSAPCSAPDIHPASVPSAAWDEEQSDPWSGEKQEDHPRHYPAVLQVSCSLYSIKLLNLFQYGIHNFFLAGKFSLLPVLKVIPCFHLQYLWSGPRRCDQPVHYHLTTAPRGRGRCRSLGHRPGRAATSVSCRCAGASPADYPDVTQHQRAHRQSLCCHVQGLCMRDKLRGRSLKWPLINMKAQQHFYSPF